LGITKRIKDRIFGQPLNELITDIRIYTKQIRRTQQRFDKRVNELRDKAKQEILGGESSRAKMYMQQSLKAKNTAFSLDMFVLAMEDLAFDLQNASSVNMMAPVMGKISKSLGKLDLLKTGNVSQIMGKVNSQIERAGFSIEQIYDDIRDYEPFSISTLTDESVDLELDKLTEEVMAEGPAMGLPPSKLSELEKKRDELRNK